MTLRDNVRQILQRWDEHEWETQGFGMLRTYLPGEDEPRLQIWDQRLLVWEFSPIHDHPWDFTSTVIAGHLFNQRYLRCQEACFYRPPVGEYNEALITPGPDAEGTHEVRKCNLATLPLEMYGSGESYSQTWDELHQTKYSQGTITLITRRRTRPDGDLASSIWQGDGPWVSARPRAATVSEVRAVTQNALRTWWL